MLSSAIHGRALVDGPAAGLACVLAEPLSLWGGFDPKTGTITDNHHPDLGRCLTGLVVVMSSGRGSSSASSVLAEAVRLGTAPAAFLLTEPDEILVLGAIVGHELYDTVTPVILVSASSHNQINDGQRLIIEAGGRVDPG